MKRDAPAPGEAGRQVGSYRIEALLGEGGMGVVYRAFDTRLNRHVAVKFLSSQLADPDARRRFQREAQMASALNHPHILTVHDAGEIDGQQYLVTELVDGGTLRQWAQSERRTWRQVADLLSGVADGLAAAHAAGILHRDLKPENVLVSRGGYAKLADFGLAKLVQPATDNTVTRIDSDVNTRRGVVVGTIPYMSPEQASGQPLDARSDIFSFGAILYDVLAGRRPFTGPTDVDVLHAIVREVPAPLPADVPPALRMAVEKALEKDAADRYQSMRELAVDLRRATRQSSVAGADPVPTGSAAVSRRGMRTFVGAVLFAAVAAAGFLAGQFRPAEPSGRAVVFQRLTDFVGVEESPAISPDGRSVAFVAPSGGRRHIWVRLLAGGSPLQLTRGDADHEQPRWAPDSSAIIYYSPSARPDGLGAIWEISALGGTPRRITAALTAGDISHDGERLAVFRPRADKMELALISRDGATSYTTWPLDDMGVLSSIRWSPDDTWLAYSHGFPFTSVLTVLPIAGGAPRALTQTASVRGLAWLPDGTGLLYASSAASTVPYPPVFNLRSIDRDGTNDRQLTFGDLSYREPDVIASGAVAASQLRTGSDVWRFPVAGTPADNTRLGVRLTHQTGQVQTPSASPDGTEVVYLSDSGGHGNLWIAKTDGSSVRQLTFDRDPAVVVGAPVWSPSGEWINFIRTRAGRISQWLVRPDGTNARELVSGVIASHWSGDGKWLYYSRVRGNDSCIEKMPSAGGPAVQVRCGEPSTSAVAPDGSTLYSLNNLGGNRTGDFELRRARPETAPFEPIGRIASNRAGVDPTRLNLVISPDGHWLATGLSDRGTTNLWAISTADGSMRQLTDFGDRAVEIVRRVSWAPDGRSIYAAVAEVDADIVRLDGLVGVPAMRGIQ